jgi:hypothetical protein
MKDSCFHSLPSTNRSACKDNASDPQTPLRRFKLLGPSRIVLGLNSIQSTIMMLLLLLLFIDHATSLQPLLGLSLSWAVNINFTQGHRSVNFSLGSAFAMAKNCTYTVGKAVSCSTAPILEPWNPLDKNADINCTASASGLCHVAVEHGVLCVAQLGRTSSGELHVLYSSTLGRACVSDVRPGFRSLNTPASPAPSTHVGKVNDFIVTSTYSTPFHTADAIPSSGIHFFSKISSVCTGSFCILMSSQSLRM